MGALFSICKEKEEVVVMERVEHYENNQVNFGKNHDSDCTSYNINTQNDQKIKQSIEETDNNSQGTSKIDKLENNDKYIIETRSEMDPNLMNSFIGGKSNSNQWDIGKPIVSKIQQEEIIKLDILVKNDNIIRLEDYNPHKHNNCGHKHKQNIPQNLEHQKEIEVVMQEQENLSKNSIKFHSFSLHDVIIDNTEIYQIQEKKYFYDINNNIE